ncbi:MULTISPECIES: pentapeptide repeat-containing protein [Stenotrophomonas]|uniref:pentapeptide repeat-containing protein n=1 Tax=Stenotrophomonas TaxID=40323 RepID=UPI00191F2FCB|nr:MULTISPECIES: pentapeptide repeat-containing protein [Stenotrophomonas]MBL0734897.1 pentapeptide repeat-containing protein [Stenotrophomonas maltophilia]MBL0755268.1 pentapeptide repeat-containing protein [Stenotrophomonas maltophilia]
MKEDGSPIVDVYSPDSVAKAAGGNNVPVELVEGNRLAVKDRYVASNVADSKEFAFKIYVRLNAKKISFKNVSFQHCVFDSCYLNNCVFDSCDFTGSRFVACNLHQSSFSGCKFEYVTFERSQIDDDILESEAPSRENLKMRFARSLRMNFQQVGDAKAVNRAIRLELEATSVYLKKSWSSSETYFSKKYPGWKKLPQFLKWVEFKALDVIWGNGESTFKLVRAIVATHVAIAIYSTVAFSDPWDIRSYLSNLALAPGVFFGISNAYDYPVWVSGMVSACRLLSFAFLTAILVKRFGRR